MEEEEIKEGKGENGKKKLSKQDKGRREKEEEKEERTRKKVGELWGTVEIAGSLHPSVMASPSRQAG